MSDKQINVLLIEDSPGDARLIQEILADAKGSSFRLGCVDRISTGRQYLAEKEIDVVLLDLSLPDSRGLDTFIKVHTQIPHVPIIVLTGLDDELLAVKAVRQGAQDYLVKGQVDSNVLIRSMRYAIERKRAEEKLRESEQQYRMIFESSPEVIGVIDTKGNVLDVNRRLYDWLGYEPEEVIGKNFLGLPFLPDESKAKAMERLSQAKTGKKTHPYELDFIIKNGERRVGRILASPIRDKSGKLIGELVMASDVTEQRRMEESLRVERDKLENILDNLGDSVIIEDENYNIVYQNKTSIRMEGTLTGQKCYAVFHGRDEPCTDFCAVQHFLKSNNNGPFLHSPQTKDGSSWETFAVPILDERSERVVLEVSRNVTEQKQLRQQLLQSEKMSALGQLISGVVHELNNPLTGILGFSQLLLVSSNPDEDTRHSLKRINQEAERARKIVQNLLTFARQRKPEKKKVRINEIVNRVLDLRAYEMRVSNVEVVRKIDPNLPLLLADEHQLQQVFVNIIINAEQAMLDAHGRGRLEVAICWDEEQDVVQIFFRDDGPGIPEKHLAKIFDPFFTTKPIGKGTGLGLSISYGIVQEHGGRITVMNGGDGGATFTVELPVVEIERSETVAMPSNDLKTVVVGRKRMLVVDDEASVVDLVREALEREGYVVDTAFDGTSAIRKIEENCFDAVVSDLKMPGMGGVELYLHCKEHKPHLAERFLLLTGDVVSADSLRFVEEQKVAHVSKPFDLIDLIFSVNLLFH